MKDDQQLRLNWNHNVIWLAIYWCHSSTFLTCWSWDNKYKTILYL